MFRAFSLKRFQGLGCRAAAVCLSGKFAPSAVCENWLCRAIDEITDINQCAEIEIAVALPLGLTRIIGKLAAKLASEAGINKAKTSSRRVLAP